MDGQSEGASIIKILGQAGANLNVSNIIHTPLTYATEQSNVELVKALLEAGADPNAKAESGRAPLSMASNQEILQLLLKAKADPNVVDQSGAPLLMSAIENGYVEMVAMLLENGADIHVTDSYGNSPLKVANNYSQTEIAELLKKKGATE